DAGDLVYAVKTGTVDDPSVRQHIADVVTQLKAVKNNHIASVTRPYDPAGARFVSPDRKIAYDEILFDVQSNDVPVDVASHMRSLVAQANATGVQVELGGSMFPDQSQPASELIGILAAIIILLIAFGSLLAMGLPIMTALFGIGIGLAVVQLLANFMDIP